MQTTLLGLAIAIILALVAALVGPLLINWNGYRSAFETEARHLIGLRVRVSGSIEARLLPSPQLTLHDIEIGKPGANNIRARALDIEFALGPLLRGEWHASKLQLTAPRLHLGLNRSGRLEVPKLAIGFKPDALSVDSLSVVGGRVTLSNAANGAKIALDQLYFNGTANSLIGPINGEGDVVIDGKHYPYRLAVRRYHGDGTLKFHVDIDTREYLLSIKADGTLKLAGGRPRFEGSLDLARPASLASADGKQLSRPWRLHGKLKVAPTSALMDEIEFQYGSQDQGFKLTGVAELAYGKRPGFAAKLSAEQINLDRVLNNQHGGRALPGAAVRRLAQLAAQAFRPTIPIQIGVGIDQLTLGGGTVQNMRGDISADASGWNLNGLSFRAPGFTQVKLSGHLRVRNKNVTFGGPAELDSTDPNAFVAWLEGRRAPAQSDLRPLRLKGRITLGKEIAIEHLQATFAHKSIAGRFVYVAASDSHPSKLDAVLKAPELDLDAARDFGEALLSGSHFAPPHDMTLVADIGHATIAGMAAGNLSARVKVKAGRWQIDRFRVADLGGASFSASGGLSLATRSLPSNLRVDFNAQNMTPVIALLTRFAPNTAQLLERVAAVMAPTKLHAQLSLDGAVPSQAKLRVNGSLGKMRLALTGECQVALKAFRIGHMRLEGKLQAADGKELVSMLGLSTVVTVGAGPGALTLNASGPAQGQWQVDGRLTAGGLEARANGTARPLASTPTATLHATIARADAVPLRRGRTGAALPVTFTGPVVLDGVDLTLSDINATVAGAKLKGKLTVSLMQPHRLQGDIKADSIDGAAVIGAAIGIPPAESTSRDTSWAWSKEPFSKGLFGNMIGIVALKAGRFDMLPGLMVRQFRATLRLDKDQLALSNMTGLMSQGQFTGALSFRATDDGLAAHAKFAMTGADAADLLKAAARPPVTGLLDLSIDLQGAGLSPAALTGALHGSGKIALSNAKLADLDPRAFHAVAQAVDKGLPVDSARILEVVRQALDQGELAVGRAQGTITVDAGQLRLTGSTANANAAKLSLGGNLDLTDGLLDARLVLSGPRTAGGTRPDIFVALTGPITAPSRSLDITALTGWLTLRAVDNQAKRLRAIEEAAPRLNTRAAAPVNETTLPPKSDRAAIPNGKAAPAFTGGSRAAPKSNSAPIADRLPPLEPPLDLMPSAPNSDQAPPLPAPIEIGPLPMPGGAPPASLGPQN